MNLGGREDHQSLLPQVKHPIDWKFEGSDVCSGQIIQDYLLGPAFEVEAELLSTSALEAFFIDCISSLRDFIAHSMDA